MLMACLSLLPIFLRNYLLTDLLRFFNLWIKASWLCVVGVFSNVVLLLMVF